MKIDTDYLVSAKHYNRQVKYMGQLNKREIVPGPRNLVYYPGLVNSWILEENLQPLFTKPV